MKILSVISTPFQLFCLKEYFFQKNIEDYFIIALVENQNQRQRLENLSKLINIELDEIHYLRPITQYFKISAPNFSVFSKAFLSLASYIIKGCRLPSPA